MSVKLLNFSHVHYKNGTNCCSFPPKLIFLIARNLLLGRKRRKGEKEKRGKEEKEKRGKEEMKNRGKEEREKRGKREKEKKRKEEKKK